MKRCARCHLVLPRTDFSVKSRAKDGLQGYCNACNREQARLWARSPKGRRLVRQYAKRLDRKAKVRCRQATRAMKLTPQACLACGCSRTQPHHLDYTRPDQVVWLCDPCHRTLRREHPPFLVLLESRPVLILAGERAAA